MGLAVGFYPTESIDHVGAEVRHIVTVSSSGLDSVKPHMRHWTVNQIFD
jgi:hypothetical protein